MPEKRKGMSSSVYLFAAICMTFLSGFFWLIGLIPIVNIFTNAIYWMIWATVYIALTASLILTSPKNFFIGIAVAVPGIILGFIPLINWIPWAALSSFFSFFVVYLYQKSKETSKT